MPQRVDILVSEEDFDLAEGLAGQHAPEGWEEESLPDGRIRIRAHGGMEMADALASAVAAMLPAAEISRSEIPDQDWGAAWREHFTPVEAGGFLVLPPWLADNDSGGRRKLIIEPKSAFGTGHHETTALCLEAISRLAASGRVGAGSRFLDVGTGTGILGMACVSLGMDGLGVDIDPLSLSNAEENCALNGLPFPCRLGSVEAVAGESFDLVLANVLAGPLRDMAPDMMRLMAGGGALVLSGVLDVQAESVAQAYAPLGRPDIFRKGEWVALVWA